MESRVLRNVAVLVAVLVLVAGLPGCWAEQPAREAEGEVDPRLYEEGPNLLSVLRGTVILDRSGELNFEHASLLAIDGHPASGWSSPPGNLEQWLVMELPVRTRIDEVGLSNGVLAASPNNPKRIRYELSEDGVDWIDVGAFEFDSGPGAQMHHIVSHEARFARVTTLESQGESQVMSVTALLARGDEVDAYERPSVSGHWMLNDLAAHFHEDEGRVFGVVEMEPPMLIDGAWDDRLVKFTWVRGRSYGIGLMTANRDATALNGLWWYASFVDPGNELGHPWFGARLGDPGDVTFDTSMVAQLHIERSGRYPLFGLLFDEEGKLDRDSSKHAVAFIGQALAAFPDLRVRLEVADYHDHDKARNMARSEQRRDAVLDGLVAMGVPLERLIVVAIGSERSYPYLNGELHRIMYSRVDLSLTAID